MNIEKQKTLFKEGEADAYYARNSSCLSSFKADEDPVIRNLRPYVRENMTIAEIGCGMAGRLNALAVIASGSGLGLDPSAKAIHDATVLHPGLRLVQGTADVLPWEDKSIDILVYGFCLYLCDREDLFKIAAEGDRVLSEGGIISILDFKPPFPYKNHYSHLDGVFSYKLDYSSLWSWNPAYVLLKEEVCEHSMAKSGGQSAIVPDDRIAVTILQKLGAYAYPSIPVYGDK